MHENLSASVRIQQSFEEGFSFAYLQNPTRTRNEVERPSSASHVRWKWVGHQSLLSQEHFHSGKDLFRLKGYVYKPNCRIYCFETPQKVNVLCGRRQSLVHILFKNEAIRDAKAIEKSIALRLMTFSWKNRKMLMWTTFASNKKAPHDTYRSWNYQFMESYIYAHSLAAWLHDKHETIDALKGNIWA